MLYCVYFVECCHFTATALALVRKQPTVSAEQTSSKHTLKVKWIRIITAMAKTIVLWRYLRARDTFYASIVLYTQRTSELALLHALNVYLLRKYSARVCVYAWKMFILFVSGMFSFIGQISIVLATVALLKVEQYFMIRKRQSGLSIHSVETLTLLSAESLAWIEEISRLYRSTMAYFNASRGANVLMSSCLLWESCHSFK